MILVIGVNFVLWGTIGLLRVLEEGWTRRRPSRRGDVASRVGVTDVAVLMAAHNEETVIADSLEAIAKLVPRNQIHVVSDGSTDRTVALARAAGAAVIETAGNVGKASALREAIERFELVDRFTAVLLLDADTRVDPGYVAAALPQFDDPRIVAVAGAVRSHWDRHRLSMVGRIVSCHRQRIYTLTQRLMKIGQTWRFTNATQIVPGFASMYRTSVLPEIEMDPPGLVIEDFNMTFEVYRKRLGKVAFTLDSVAVTQDPDNLRDYIRQTRRWALGLWQTVRRHRPRPSLFTAMVTLLLLELLTSSLLFVLLPILLIVVGLPQLFPPVLNPPLFAAVHSVLAAHLSPASLLVGLFGPDLLLTCVVAAVERRAWILAYWLAFPLLRILDAALALYTVPLAWVRSSGRWTSPARRSIDAPFPAEGLRAAGSDDEQGSALTA
ncbi:glycosyltransferase [Pseudonocardia hispaniensis]|uniref:Glycosyltransferase n=1 Tax=Pseudonocardia hispaniensis TaxID=904933 RepID=A0ABW1J309_9PSEU